MIDAILGCVLGVLGATVVFAYLIPRAPRRVPICMACGGAHAAAAAGPHGLCQTCEQVFFPTLRASQPPPDTLAALLGAVPELWEPWEDLAS